MPSVAHNTIKKVSPSGSHDADDFLAVEEPLEIRLDYVSKFNPPDGYRDKIQKSKAGTQERVLKSISVTMRTPGYDEELAIGFLFTEGIIKSVEDVAAVTYNANENIISVSLCDEITPQTDKLERNFYTTSSCGVCGKASIEAVRVACNIPDVFDKLRIPSALIYRLPALLRSHQEVFEHTGGLHACALFDANGALLLMREDVGRHNALDKLIGAALRMNLLPLDNHILLLSGRASFELVQKAVMAGVKVVAAVGAPSSLAAEMAEEWGMTLIGFLRGERFNIYSGAERILVNY